MNSYTDNYLVVKYVSLTLSINHAVEILNHLHIFIVKFILTYSDVSLDSWCN